MLKLGGVFKEVVGSFGHSANLPGVRADNPYPFFNLLGGRFFPGLGFFNAGFCLGKAVGPFLLVGKLFWGNLCG